MFILISYEAPQRRLRFLAGDSETNRSGGPIEIGLKAKSK
jgi:hypothetical protein